MQVDHLRLDSFVRPGKGLNTYTKVPISDANPNPGSYYRSI
jgi:hypothetical protein